MLRLIFIFQFTLSSFTLFSQPPCLPAAGGIPASDEPPGCIMCGPIYSGSTIGFTADTTDFVFPCGTVDNSQWITILADSSGNIQATILASNCRQGAGVELAIYDQNLNIVSNCFSSDGVNLPGNVSASGLSPGEPYYIFVDGFNGDECDILVTTSGGSNTGPPDPPGVMTITPDTSPLCIGAIVCYSIESVFAANDYEWVIPGNSTIVSGGGSQDTAICVEYIALGGGVIRVTPSNSCFPGIPAIEPVIVLPILPTLRPPIFLCPEDTTGFLRDTCFKTALGCDSCVTSIFVPNVQVPNLIDAYVCGGNCFQVGDSCYSQTPSSTIRILDAQQNGCDSLIILNITESDTVPAPIISCTSDLSSIEFNWHPLANASEYIIFVNGDSIEQTTNTNFRIDSLDVGQTIELIVQPIGDFCNFEMGMVSCSTNTTSTNDIDKTDFVIFPNPTSDIVSIRSEYSLENIKVMTSLGNLLFETTEKEIDLSQLPNGIYFFIIKSEQRFFIKKVVKN